MTTPLFPKNDGFVTIRQGQTGDCYLLAALDCILNSGPEGYATIKSLFKETEEGIEVRFKSGDLSKNLQKDKLQGKYKYHYDPINNQDVFFIDKKKIQEIDQTTYGVRSNSLAIKILERLSSYYFISDWNQKLPLASILAHNNRLEKRYEGSSSAFVGNLLGIMTYNTRNALNIIRLKTIAPLEPIYISMKYGQIDANGETHDGHALRIDRIIPNPKSAGGYDFVLVNPWDNQKRETYSLNEIQQRDCSFGVFSTKPYEHDLKKKLLKAHEKIGQKVFGDVELYQMIRKMSEVNGKLLDLRTIGKCVKLYERISGFSNLFAALSLSEQKTMISCVDLESKPTNFIRSFLSSAPTARPAVIEHLDLTKYYVNKISQYPIESVNFDDPIESVNKYKKSVISELQKIKDRALAQKKYTQLDSVSIEKALAEKLREVDALFRFGLFFNAQDIDLNQELNIDANQELNIPLNQGIDINRYRFGLFSKPVNINPNQEPDLQNKPKI
ncbi:hypothetical protein [Legionella pneumophila]|uniref:Thiol protease n=1 Tax=Legionella pneumophila subsp. pascullei TaxID=91890 RepID=A0AAX2IVY7_LEGPN|nr:hypothetical protein [Legionella pneumophila]AMP90171.1 hypothetical protein AXF35_10925 [Legionella pneumophila subsp. pascullei]AMP92160.1 hypothetical protein AXF36_05875 [Legionella pneumophila subsp. pascullei]AMP95126.1 hypothetical protein AXF37_05765 [Legionella pneumophila subsp. pascullei]SQG90007.1 thiol protease [Legionella pneumophila subsp. pascullei]VEH05849.1 thiol protease [Legionella pneumophila subsp. pascullei]